MTLSFRTAERRSITRHTMIHLEKTDSWCAFQIPQPQSHPQQTREPAFPVCMQATNLEISVDSCNLAPKVQTKTNTGVKAQLEREPTRQTLLVEPPMRPLTFLHNQSALSSRQNNDRPQNKRGKAYLGAIRHKLTRTTRHRAPLLTHPSPLGVNVRTREELQRWKPGLRVLCLFQDRAPRIVPGQSHLELSG